MGEIHRKTQRPFFTHNYEFMLYITMVMYFPPSNTVSNIGDPNDLTPSVFHSDNER